MLDLKAFRKDHKLTQQETAQILEISQGFYANIESGSRPLPEKRVEMLREKGYEVDKYIISEYRENKAGTVSIERFLSIIDKYEHRLEQKDEQIQQLIVNQDRKLNEILTHLKKSVNVPQDGNVECADAGSSVSAG